MSDVEGPVQARLDAPYTWLVIAAEREVAAWAVRRGFAERVSPLVAGDAVAAEFHATLGAVTAAAFSVEALCLETLERLRTAPGRGDRWEVPAVDELRQRSGRRPPTWERILHTLRYDSVLDESEDRGTDLKWLFDLRNEVVHFDTRVEALTVRDEGPVTLSTLRTFRAETATRAVDIAYRILEGSGRAILTSVQHHRPRSAWFGREYDARDRDA